MFLDVSSVISENIWINSRKKAVAAIRTTTDTAKQQQQRQGQVHKTRIRSNVVAANALERLVALSDDDDDDDDDCDDGGGGGDGDGNGDGDGDGDLTEIILICEDSTLEAR
ncbi:hypothetical protein RUM44_010549 [Polyplax serrata]|uniref:Uncharacterized protein n=1 Tax=Polyplax serrata TaxID=468196 RepID=A0ABR1AXN3_POLSC